MNQQSREKVWLHPTTKRQGYLVGGPVFTHLTFKAAGERWAVHTAEERPDDISVAAVASERNPLGDKMPRTGCRGRLLLCEGLRAGDGGSGAKHGEEGGGLRHSCCLAANAWRWGEGVPRTFT